MRLHLGDGYPYPFPYDVSADENDRLNEQERGPQITLEGVKSFEMRFTMTVQFATHEAFTKAKEQTGWDVWDKGDFVLEGDLSQDEGRGDIPAVIVRDRTYCQVFIEA